MEVTAYVTPEAELGPRDVELEWDGEAHTLSEGLVIEPGAFALSPARAACWGRACA